MDELRILAPNGVCGSGFLETTFEKALALQPHFMGCDAARPIRPEHLGGGHAAFPREAVKRDLRLMLLGARRLKIPLLIGSAGTAGGDVHLEWFVAILKEIAAAESLGFKLAVIHSEQDKDYLKKRLREGRIRPLDPAPEFNEQVIDRSERIVGMMGAEPYTRALAAGAEVVIAGRSSDTAIFAAIPIERGFPEGLAWHAGKILDARRVGGSSTRPTACLRGCARITSWSVPNPRYRCSPQSIASQPL